MHFSYTDNGNGSKSGKFALVVGLHVVVGVLFVHSLNFRNISLPSLPDPVQVTLQSEPPAPQTPPDPPRPMPKLALPDLVVPKVEVDIPTPLDPPPVQASTLPDPKPAETPSTAPANSSDASKGQMRTAVLADANSCALPAYPASAARNGDTGTTLLALLVGADGRVSSARVQHSSGSRDLDRAAIQALSLCKFKPATNGGTPEAGWAQLAYVWKLD